MSLDVNYDSYIYLPKVNDEILTGDPTDIRYLGIDHKWI